MNRRVVNLLTILVAAGAVGALIGGPWGLGWSLTALFVAFAGLALHHGLSWRPGQCLLYLSGWVWVVLVTMDRIGGTACR